MFIVKHYVIIAEKFRFKKKLMEQPIFSWVFHEFFHEFFMRQNAQEEILDLVYLAI